MSGPKWFLPKAVTMAEVLPDLCPRCCPPTNNTANTNANAPRPPEARRLRLRLNMAHVPVGLYPQDWTVCASCDTRFQDFSECSRIIVRFLESQGLPGLA
jgi:hypothetical protein